VQKINETLKLPVDYFPVVEALLMSRYFYYGVHALLEYFEEFFSEAVFHEACVALALNDREIIGADHAAVYHVDDDRVDGRGAEFFYHVGDEGGISVGAAVHDAEVGVEVAGVHERIDIIAVQNRTGLTTAP